MSSTLRAPQPTGNESRWLLSTIGRRGYMAAYLRAAAKRLGMDVWLVGTADDPMTSGFAVCDLARLLPPHQSPDYPQAVAELVREEGIQAILSFHDADVLRLAAMRDQLVGEGVACFFPAMPGATITHDKWLLARAATSVAVPIPATTLDAVDATVGWPRLRKPRRKAASEGILLAKSADELRLMPPDDDVLYQELVEGQEATVHLLTDLAGRVVRAGSWRKLRMRNGETDAAVTWEAPDITDLSIRLATALELVGPVDFDWMVTDSGPLLLEVNSRFGAGYPVTEFAGGGFTEALLKLVRGEAVDPTLSLRPDVFMMKTLGVVGGNLDDGLPTLVEPQRRSNLTLGMAATRQAPTYRNKNDTLL